jgi:hypothetical protein
MGRRWPRLGLVTASAALLLGACGLPAVDAPARGNEATVTVGASSGRSLPASSSCPATRAPEPPFVPPAPHPPTPPRLYGQVFWYGTDGLWTWLEADGTGRRSDKSLWWREGYDWQTETSPRLLVTGRRLDAAAPAVTSSDATNGFREDIGAFMLVGLDFPTGGCWEVTGHYGAERLRYVVRVR